MKEVVHGINAESEGPEESEEAGYDPGERGGAIRGTERREGVNKRAEPHDPPPAPKLSDPRDRKKRTRAKKQHGLKPAPNKCPPATHERGEIVNNGVQPVCWVLVRKRKGERERQRTRKNNERERKGERRVRSTRQKRVRG